MPDENQDKKIGTDVGGDVDGNLNVAGGDIVTHIQQSDTSVVPLVILGVIGVIAVVAVVALVVVKPGQGGASQTTSEPVAEEADLRPTSEPTATSTAIPTTPPSTPTGTEAEAGGSEETTATETVTPSLTPTVAFTQPLYDDDFVGWLPQQGIGISGSTGSLGGYLIKGAGLLWTSQSASTIGGDFELTATFDLVSYTGTGGFIGVLFSFNGGNRFIAAGVQSGGEMGVIDQMTVVNQQMSSGALDAPLDLGPHTLRVRVEGQTITLTVDGMAGNPNMVSNVQTGRVGLYVDGRDGAVEVLYHGLAVFGPAS